MPNFTPEDVVAIDIETTGLEKDAKILGVGWYETKEKKGYITDRLGIKSYLQQAATNMPHGANSLRFAAHNGKYDQTLLYRETGVMPEIAFDTYLAATLLPLDKKPKSLTLDFLAGHFYGVPSWKDKEFLDTIATQPVDQVAYYNTYDCYYTKKLTRTLWDILLEEGTLNFFLNVVMPTANLLAGIEARGVLFDASQAEEMQRELLSAISDTLSKLNNKYSDYLEKYEQAVFNAWVANHKNPAKITDKMIGAFHRKDASKFNWSSPKQVLWLLKDQLKFDCKKWDRFKGCYKTSVDKEVLKRYEDQHPIFIQLLQLRGMEKLDGYFKGWLSAVDKDSRIRAHYHQDTVRLGGRLSSSGPNLQQVPRANSTSGIWRDKNCRRLFRAGVDRQLVKIDYRQIEPRLLAHYALDKNLIKVFTDRKDFYEVVISDALGLTAKPTKEQRAAGKTLGLAIAYGAQAKKVAQIINNHLNLKYDYIEGQRCVERWWAARQPFDRLKRELAKQVAEVGYIETFMGRKIYLNEKLAQQKHAEGKQLNLLNTLAQVSAGDLLNYSQTCLEDLCREEGYVANLIMQVHDEAVWEVKANDVEPFYSHANNIMCQKMMGRFGLDTPLEIEYSVGDTWGG